MVVYSMNQANWNRGASKQIIKIHQERVDNTYKCKCGKSVVIRPKVESVVCRWCGYLIFRDKEKQIEHDKEIRLREELLKFKKELRRELKLKEQQALHEHLEQKKEEMRKLYDDRTN